jgi:hypothetical protein
MAEGSRQSPRVSDVERLSQRLTAGLSSVYRLPFQPTFFFPSAGAEYRHAAPTEKTNNAGATAGV